MAEQETTYQVVALDDARALVEEVADDAATSAVDAGGTRLDDSARDIAAAAVEQSGSRVDDAAASLARSAADDAAGLVGQYVASEVSSLDVGNVTATISDEQWDYMQGAVRISLTCSVFCMMLLAALLGSQLVGYLLDRWRS